MEKNQNQNNPENTQETRLAFLNMRGKLLSHSSKEEREEILESIKEWEN